MTVRVRVRGVPDWVPLGRLLGGEDWVRSDDAWVAERDRQAAADLMARTRGLGLGGAAIEVDVSPRPKRMLIRQARTDDARRRRDTTPGLVRRGVRLDEEARWSLTPEVLALALGRTCARSTVIDATCGAGGNAIGFARAGCRVIAIDHDAERLAQARHNASIYEVAHLITFVLGDAVVESASNTADVLFVDPPWGRDWDRIRTTPADLPPLEALLAHRHRFGQVIVKVPPSFDPRTIPGGQPRAWFGEALGDRQRVKFVTITCATTAGP